MPDRLMVKTPEGAFSAAVARIGDATHVSYRGHVYVIERSRHKSHGAAGAENGEIRAPMPGLIVDVLAIMGAEVERGAKILVLEAMKTQQTFTAPFDGVISALWAKKGAQVAEGELLAVIASNDRE